MGNRTGVLEGREEEEICIVSKGYVMFSVQDSKPDDWRRVDGAPVGGSYLVVSEKSDMLYRSQVCTFGTLPTSSCTRRLLQDVQTISDFYPIMRNA